MRRIQPAASGTSSRIHAPWQWLLPAALLGIAASLAAFGDTARELLRYERDAIAAGEIWRLASGHLVHLGWPHYLLNAGGLVLVWVLVGARLHARAWLVVLAVVIAGLDAGFWLFSPELTWYVGLSGVLHGLLFAGLVAGWRAAPAESGILAVILVAKLAYEQLYGALPGSAATAGGPVIVDAHLYGSIAGIIAAAAILIREGGQGDL